ncbi:hypothetical protein F0562_005312 [Nyssa sinensis]|uniref:Protein DETOXIFICATION n=1 Tax=Nyssa sinensis TaxID=561372 RepID=A0A5J5AHU5_9ASTE|nr:hypothetical protein F0562_005312 [Nyssa sinensis]
MEEVTMAEIRGERCWRVTWGIVFMQELKKLSYIAAPTVAATVMQYLLQVISVMMVGHLGQLSLSSVAVATSLTNVTGFSLLIMQMSSSQGWWADWILYAGKLMEHNSIKSLECQDPSISLEARKYSIWLIPALFGAAILKPVVRYLQSQSLILPMLLSSFAVLCFHVPVCWALIFKLELGNLGAALAISLSGWLNVILLGLYVKYSAACKNTRMTFSKDAFLGIGEFFRFAVPSAVMVCLKWWSLELLILLSSFFPNPKLETSVLSMCLTISTLHFTIPYGFGAAASTRVSNELGAGNPQVAQVAVWVVMFLAVTETAIVSTTLFCCRHVLGYAYSNDKQVVDYIAAMAPLISLSIVMDSLQAVISGIARGSGWQHIGAYVNIGAFYIVGTPVALILGFVLHLRAKGFWIGIVTGSTVQSTILSLIMGFTNWQNQLGYNYRWPRHYVVYLYDLYSRAINIDGQNDLFLCMVKESRKGKQMEEALLAERKGVETWGVFGEELKKLSRIAAPMVAVTVSQYLLQVVSVMMVGHLGELSLSSVAMATSFTTVTGFSLLLGLASALETLCGQAYGAKQYQKLGIYTYTAIISLIVVCLPVCLVWFFMDRLLTFIGQDPSISYEAGRYSIWLIPALFAYAILQSLVRYFQTQSLVLPMLLSSFAVLCFHVPFCWALVYKMELGNIGAALAIGISYWLNVVLLGFYMKYSSSCEKTRCPFSKDVFINIGEFFHLAIPSAVMVCLEWWSFELLTLLSGLLPNPKLEASVLSICLTTGALHYFIPYGFSAAVSTRVSNELGAENPQAARVAVRAVMVFAVGEAIIISTTLFCCRYVLGYAYSDVKEVVDYVKEMLPLICVSVILDSLNAVLSGVARGSGWQHLGAYVNLGAFYVVGIPVAVVLGFVLHLRGKGLWIGILTGSLVQFILLLLITIFTDWQKQANKARERMFERTLTPDN